MSGVAMLVPGQLLTKSCEAADIVPRNRQPDCDNPSTPLASRYGLHDRVIDADLEQLRIDLR